jgi:glycine/D-amino acid oxidase-like deaminating enzyme
MTSQVSGTADAVVIGGGHHGFVAAAVLADAGSAALELIYRDSASAR